MTFKVTLGHKVGHGELISSFTFFGDADLNNIGSMFCVCWAFVCVMEKQLLLLFYIFWGCWLKQHRIDVLCLLGICLCDGKTIIIIILHFFGMLTQTTLDRCFVFAGHLFVWWKNNYYYYYYFTFFGDADSNNIGSMFCVCWVFACVMEKQLLL